MVERARKRETQRKPGLPIVTLKAAVTHYTRCLAAEVRDAGVRVNAVSPGPAKTARFQATRTVDPDKMNSNKVSLDRYAEPEEIADAVVFLCSPEAKFIHGQLLRVDARARAEERARTRAFFRSLRDQPNRLR